MISTTDDAAAPLTDAGEFLAEYTAWLWGCGATCIRIEKNVGRIAAAWGLHCDLTVMPRQVSVVLSRPGAQGAGQMFTAKIKPCGINFDINSNLSRLSWNIADRAIKVERAGDLLEGVVTRHYRVTPAELLLVGLANASFCRLFGGDYASMAIVLVATACGFYMKGNLCSKWKLDARAAIFMAGCVSAILSCAGYVFNIGKTPDVALATSVLYLVPGIHYLNAASDLINRHYICAICRFIHAGIMTICLSTGLYAAMTIMRIGLTH